MSDAIPAHSARAAFEDAPTGAAAWPAVLSLSLGVFALVSMEFLPASVLTSIAGDLRISLGAAGQTVTTTSLVGVASALLTPIVTRRFDRRFVLWGLMALLALSNIVTAFATGYVMLLAGRFLLGISLGGFWSMAPALTPRLVPADKVPRALALISAGVSASFIAAGPLGAFLDAAMGWRNVFLLGAVVALAALIMQIISMPRLPAQAVAAFDTLGILLGRGSVRFMLLAILLVISGQFTGFTYVRPFLEQVPQFSVAAITLVLFGYGLGNVIGNFVGGVVAGRGIKLALLSFALMAGFSAALLLGFGTVSAVAAAAVALWGFAFGFAPVGFQSWMMRIAGDHPESISGLVTAAFLVAIASGAVLGGLIVDHAGASAPIAYLGAAMLAGALLIGVIGKEPKPH